MSWKKYFKVANSNGELSPLSGKGSDGLPGYGRNDGRDPMRGHADIVYRNYASRLPEVYTGHPNRVERYNQYENMDSDSEINACLDILAEFSTGAVTEIDSARTDNSVDDFCDVPTIVCARLPETWMVAISGRCIAMTTSAAGITEDAFRTSRSKSMMECGMRIVTKPPPAPLLTSYRAPEMVFVTPSGVASIRRPSRVVTRT